jgi:hypothetical protein
MAVGFKRLIIPALYLPGLTGFLVITQSAQTKYIVLKINYSQNNINEIYQKAKFN